MTYWRGVLRSPSFLAAAVVVGLLLVGVVVEALS